MQEIWLEKYRPKTLKELLGNSELVDQFKAIVEEGTVPNMILSGPPGCGKTSSVLCIGRQLLGDKFGEGVLELNASDERGIDVVRNKVKEFSEKFIRLESNRQKLIILDEADSLTTAAQQALRMIISEHSDTTRFVFCCNDSSKLIEAIQSRCILMRFSKLSNVEVSQRLMYIAEQEKVAYDDGGIEALIFTSEGDMRSAVNNLQATWIGAGKVTRDTVFSICDIPDFEIVQQIVEACRIGNRDIALESAKRLWDQSFTAYEIVNNMGKLIEASDISVQTLMKYLDEIACAKIRIINGIPTFLQIAGLLMKLCDISNSK